VTPPAGRGKRRAGVPAPAIAAARQATLGGDLIRRPTVLAALLLDQADPAETTVDPVPAPAAPGAGRSEPNFALWLRMVLSPDEAALFRSWARADPAAGRAIRRKFARATSDDDFEPLVCETRAALAAISRTGRRTGRRSGRRR
jgi:hypothetical protein